MSVAHKLKGAALKGVVVGAAGAVISLVALNGGSEIPLFGFDLPRFAVDGLVLGTSSVAADMILPYVVPWTAGSSPQLQQFEQLMLTPLLTGASLLVLQSVAAPAATGEGLGLLAQLSVGAAASIGGSYVISGMNWA